MQRLILSWMNKYNINFTTQFLRKYKKITKNNLLLVRITKTKLHMLAQDPFQPPLKTHKYKQKFSTSITGDLRIIWNFTKPDEITLFNFRGHEGKLDIYK